MYEFLNKCIKFGLTGVLCFTIDYGMLILLTEQIKLHFLLSNIIAFTLSVGINYLLSVKYVFNSVKENKKQEAAVFFILSIIGLAINEAVIWLCSEFIIYSVAKIFATGVVMIFNFITRKKYLEGDLKFES